MTLPHAGLAPQREVVRRVEAIDGDVPMGWRVEPHFGYGSRPARISMRAGVPVASAGADALAVRAWTAGSLICDAEAISGEFVASTGSRALLVLSASHAEPLVFPARERPATRLLGSSGSPRTARGRPGHPGVPGRVPMSFSHSRRITAGSIGLVSRRSGPSFAIYPPVRTVTATRDGTTEKRSS